MFKVENCFSSIKLLICRRVLESYVQKLQMRNLTIQFITMAELKSKDVNTT